MKIEFVGKFYDNHSLSIVNRNIVTNISNLHPDIEIGITALDAYDPEYQVDKNIVKQLKKLQSIDLGNSPDIQVRHTYPPIWNWPTSDTTKVIYIQPWEYNKVPFEWQYKFETFADALIVPSKYIANIFGQAGMKPGNLYVVPNGYNDNIFNTEATPDPDKYAKSDKFNFVYLGNSQWRKGLDILMNVWKEAFKKYDNVRLIIKDNPKIYGQSNILNETIKMQYKTDCAEVIYINDDLSDTEIASIFKNSQMIVHPYRAEGFGMHIQEAIACGCVPIVSAQGPTDDFVTEDSGYKIATQRSNMDITNQNVFAMKPGDAMTNMSTHSFYHEPNKDHLSNIMRTIYHSHTRENQLAEKAENSMLDNTWKNISNIYLEVFRQIASRESTVR